MKLWQSSATVRDRLTAMHSGSGGGAWIVTWMGMNCVGSMCCMRRLVHTSTDIVNNTGQDRKRAFQLRETRYTFFLNNGLFLFVGVMANPSWGNYGSPDDNGSGTFHFGNFTRLLETGVYPENYPIFNSGNGGNELPNFNPRAHEQSNELYQNGEGFGNMPWVNRFATTGQGDAGPSDNVPRVQQFVEEYNSLPHLYANSNFRQSHNSTGNGTEAQAGYDNWEWMNNNNGNAGSSTNMFDDDAGSEYSIQADEFYAEIEIDEMDREPDDFFAPVSSAYDYAYEDLPDEDPELEDRLDHRDDIVDEDNVPAMNDVRNNIRSALGRLRRRGNRDA
ncbi:hypothetical protein RHGRI_029109 [Rhododendron griersonianum]|uniref:Uncharacterized protein n=1 Tax=Rhododendron griersonianum TaxID=479676 RepID=A0AAV6II20_9ERIC|nr:hypothetical protein RHGRI_029109 [Rhododendron griersonianum]